MGEVFDSEEGWNLFLSEVVQLTDWLPCSFVFAGGDFPVGTDTNSASGTDAGSDDVEFCAVFAETHDSAVVREDFIKPASSGSHRASFGEVEISCGVRFKAEGKFVEVVGDENIVIEDFVVIAFEVSIEVV